MKIQELRDLLKKADREKLEKAFAECYKKFSKEQKQEVDGIISSIIAVEGTKKQPDFDTLKSEVETFIENAYAQNYLRPNSVVPKSEQYKWKFLVKRYIKEFLKIKAGNVNHPEMVRLFTELYKLLCAACINYLFPGEDPFYSIGWQQSELFQMLVRKIFEDGYTEENIESAITLAVLEGTGYESLPEDRAFALVSELGTNDAEYIVLEKAKEQIKETETCLTAMKNDVDRFDAEEKINILCDIFLIISIELEKVKEGLPYYFSHCRESDSEVILYRALMIADSMWADEKLWTEIYRYGLKKKIKPRESMAMIYQELQEEE